jgi:hypothetical protein
VTRTARRSGHGVRCDGCGQETTREDRRRGRCAACDAPLHRARTGGGGVPDGIVAVAAVLVALVAMVLSLVLFGVALRHVGVAAIFIGPFIGGFTLSLVTGNRPALVVFLLCPAVLSTIFFTRIAPLVSMYAFLFAPAWLVPAAIGVLLGGLLRRRWTRRRALTRGPEAF